MTMFSPLDELCNAQENHKRLILVDPLISNETSTRTKGNEIIRADARRSINLRCRRMLPFGTNNAVKIRSRLKKCGPNLTISINKRKWANPEAISRLS